MSTSFNNEYNHVWFSYAWCTPQGSERVQKFVGTPLWRMADGKDLVRVELTFHKKLPTPRYYKKRAESRRQPAPPAGEWPRQPAPATRPPPRRVPTFSDRGGDATTTDTDCTIDTASDHQTTLQEYSYHHRIADHHQHQRLPWHRRWKPEKSLQHQLQIARSSTAHTTTTKSIRFTRNTTSRTPSATSFMETTLQS